MTRSMLIWKYLLSHMFKKSNSIWRCLIVLFKLIEVIFSRAEDLFVKGWFKEKVIVVIFDLWYCWWIEYFPSIRVMIPFEVEYPSIFIMMFEIFFFSLTFIWCIDIFGCNLTYFSISFLHSFQITVVIKYSRAVILKDRYHFCYFLFFVFLSIIHINFDGLAIHLVILERIRIVLVDLEGSIYILVFWWNPPHFLLIFGNNFLPYLFLQSLLLFCCSIIICIEVSFYQKNWIIHVFDSFSKIFNYIRFRYFD